MTDDEKLIIDTILSPLYYNIIIPDNIEEVYGIFLGGSRFFNLNSAKSDYDLNIIIDTPSYLKLAQIPDVYYDRLTINSKTVHCYYIPIDFKDYNFNLYYSIEFWLAAALKGFSLDSFIKVVDKNKISQFIQNITQFLPELKNIFKTIYNNKIQVLETVDSYFTNKQNYLLLYISCLLNSMNKFSTVKQIKAIKLKNDCSDSLLSFIQLCYNNLLQEFQLYIPTLKQFLFESLDDNSTYHRGYQINLLNNTPNMIRKTTSISKQITCNIGNFYIKGTNTCLGQATTLVLNIIDITTNDLKFNPEIEWRLS